MEELKQSKYTIMVEDLVLKEEDQQFYWVPEVVEIDPDKDLTIDETNVDGELSRIGHLLAYYGDLAARLRAQLSRKEEDREAVEAFLDKEIRMEDLKKQKDAKSKPITETCIKKLIIGHEKYAGAIALLQATRLYYLRVNNLLKAMDKKSDAVITLSYSQRSERKNF